MNEPSSTLETALESLLRGIVRGEIQCLRHCPKVLEEREWQNPQ
jgi:hypothetical protein